jgi:hypothetical protein
MRKLLVPRRKLITGAAAFVAAAPYISKAQQFSAAAVNGLTPDGDPWANLDGRQQAPATGTFTFQNPTLVNGYPIASPPGARVRKVSGSYAIIASGRAQPPWMIAGVDYPVGCPISSFGTNVAWNGLNAGSGGDFTSAFTGYVNTNWPGKATYSFPRVQFDGAVGVNFDKWDLRGICFDTGTGGANGNWSFTNCLFGLSTRPSATGWENAQNNGIIGGQRAILGLTVKYCYFNLGANFFPWVDPPNPPSPANYRAFDYAADPTHPVLIMYNYFVGSPGQIGSAQGLDGVGATETVKYNYMDNIYPGAGPSMATVTACSSVSAPLIRITISPATDVATNTILAVQGVGGVPAATGYWLATRIAAGVYDLQGSNISGGVFTSGGLWTWANGINFNHMNYRQGPATFPIGNGGIFIWQFNTSNQYGVFGADGVQISGGSPHTSSTQPHIDYNTWVSAPVTSPGHGPPFANGNNSASTMIHDYSFPGGSSDYTIIPPATAIGNFMDQRGGGGMHNQSSNGFSSYADVSQNISMVDGATIVPT